MKLTQIICVAEKPSISKSVANILSGGQMQTTATGSPYIKNYQFSTYYQNRQCELTMTSLLGHLMEYEFDQHKFWNSATTPLLFTAKITKRVKENMKKLESNIKTLARRAQMLVIWTDCDRF
jgi:DNA topoisomerase-3